MSQTSQHEQGGEETGAKLRNYLRFLAMIATSVVVMYVLTYTNVFSIDHIRISEERIYMALLMGAGMAIVMLLYMWGMYRDRRVNLGIIIGALVFGGVAFFLSQSQALVGDVAYMDGMIPHHSIADPHQRTCRHRGPARARARRRDHRGAAPGDRRDGLAHRRHRGERPGHHRSRGPGSAGPRVHGRAVAGRAGSGRSTAPRNDGPRNQLSHGARVQLRGKHRDRVIACVGVIGRDRGLVARVEPRASGAARTDAGSAAKVKTAVHPRTNRRDPG